MSNNYFSISYDDAMNFLKSLSEDKISDLYDLYNITNEDGVNDNSDLSPAEKEDKINALAAIISDEDLYNLGYTNTDNSSDSDDSDKTINIYNFSVEDVGSFLLSLDEDVLSDLFQKYSAVNVDDLAIGITDAELVSLGFDKLKCDDVSSPFSDDGGCEDTHHSFDLEDNFIDDYSEEFDFLEDVNYSIPVIVVDPTDFIFCTDCDYSFESLKSQLDPNLVCSCDKLDFDGLLDDYSIDGCYGDNLVFFKIVPVTYPEQIQEEVVINSELNPALFDNETQLLKPEVFEQLNEYIDGFVTKMNEKSIDVSFNDIHLIGSNAGYLYTPESDIDIHFIWSYPMDKDNFEQMRAEFVDYMTTNPLIIDGHGVELNLEDGINMEATTKRRYSIVNNNWVDNSNTEEVYTVDDLAMVEGYENVVDEYAKRIDDVIKDDSYAEAIALKQEIRSNRSEDLANSGSLSIGNVVFKELRNSGKFGELREFIKDKELAASNQNAEE